MISNNNKHLLRMEGVNLSGVLDDTNEISVRRGAGLMLRQAVLDVESDFKELQAVSKGASVGLFQFVSDRPDSLVDGIRNALNGHYPDLTFVVDAVELGGDFRQALEAVTAKNRYRQFQQMTLVPPKVEKQATGCCEMNQIHPASPETAKWETVSMSVKRRFESGRDRRQGFYDEELETGADGWRHQFTNNLEQLSHPASNQDFGNLNDKMAVIYLDGNCFGKIQRGCDNAEELQRFDKTNRNNRRLFLQGLLNNAVNDRDFLDETRRIRLEILLWGGDEIILIVPAWKGMEVIQYFYRISKEWGFDKTSTEKIPLTHAGGIVFPDYP